MPLLTELKTFCQADCIDFAGRGCMNRTAANRRRSAKFTGLNVQTLWFEPKSFLTQRRKGFLTGQ
jgi:hypothetical protein